MFISVIIPTFNGAHKIGNLLNSLLNQSFDSFEVIVVIDGSTDNTLKIISAFENKFDSFLMINQKNGGRSKSRNAGAKQAKGDILLFFDDDMRIEPNVLLLHKQHHQLNINSVCIGTQLEDFNVLQNDIQLYKAHCSRKWAKPLEENNGQISSEKPYLTAAHFSISKSLFFEVNGFDEKLTDAEDFDLAVRLTLLGIKLYYNKNISGWHDDFITLKSYIKRVREYAKAHQKLVLIKPELYKNRFSDYQPNVPNKFKMFIYQLFASKFLLSTVESKNFSLFVPFKVRIKIYAIIIAAFGYYFPQNDL